MGRTMPLPTAAATAPFALQKPISSRSPLPPQDMIPEASIPSAYIVTGGPGGSGRRPIVPASAGATAAVHADENSALNPALLFVVLAAAVATLGVLVFLRFHAHDESPIEIPKAHSVSSAVAPPRSTGPVRPPAGVSSATGAAPAVAKVTTAGATGGPVASSPPAATASVPKVTAPPTKHHSSSAKSGGVAPETTTRGSSAPDDAPAPPPSTSGGGGGGKGQLTVVCVPACDEVLDGRTALGPSPIFKRPTSLGAHRITLKVNDPPSEKVVEVVVGADEPTVVRQPMGR